MAWSLKAAIVGSILALAAALSVMTAMAFVASSPPTVNFASGHKNGQPVHVTLQTVGSIGFGPHLYWVSYMTRDPQGKWVHTTLWDLPAHTKIDMTIDQYDSGSPLRNQQFGRIAGVAGGAITVNGKRVRVINGAAGNGIAHTFAVPTLGIYVPLLGVSSTASLCSAAPCTVKSPHNVIRFSFTTPGTGSYPWQCFVPCGLGYLYGNGGPMQTVGYMDGFINVVSA